MLAWSQRALKAHGLEAKWPKYKEWCLKNGLSVRRAALLVHIVCLHASLCKHRARVMVGRGANQTHHLPIDLTCCFRKECPRFLLPFRPLCHCLLHTVISSFSSSFGRVTCSLIGRRLFASKSTQKIVVRMQTTIHLSTGLVRRILIELRGWRHVSTRNRPFQSNAKQTHIQGSETRSSTCPSTAGG